MLTLISMALYVLNFAPPAPLLENSAFYFLLLLTVILIVSYISLINKYLNYLSPAYLTTHFKERNSSGEKGEKYYAALIDLLLISLNKGNDQIVVSINEFLVSEFKKVRVEAKGGIVIYPQAFYTSFSQLSLIL